LNRAKGKNNLYLHGNDNGYYRK